MNPAWINTIIGSLIVALILVVLRRQGIQEASISNLEEWKKNIVKSEDERHQRAAQETRDIWEAIEKIRDRCNRVLEGGHRGGMV